MFVRVSAAVAATAVIAAMMLMMVSCTQPAEVIEVPVTVEVPVEITREVPVTGRSKSNEMCIPRRRCQSP